VIRGIGYRLQEEAKQHGGLTVRAAIAFLDDCDTRTAGALRAFGAPWLDRRVWVRGFGSRLTVEDALEPAAGAPYVQITAD
jgi:hypothetical protein